MAATRAYRIRPETYLAIYSLRVEQATDVPETPTAAPPCPQLRQNYDRQSRGLLLGVIPNINKAVPEAAEPMSNLR
jgi:hypothetical protein